MDDLQFHPHTLDDMEEAHDHACDVFNAIEALQETALWTALPLETRRALCAAHAHSGVLADQLAHLV